MLIDKDGFMQMFNLEQQDLEKLITKKQIVCKSNGLIDLNLNVNKKWATSKLDFLLICRSKQVENDNNNED